MKSECFEAIVADERWCKKLLLKDFFFPFFLSRALSLGCWGSESVPSFVYHKTVLSFAFSMNDFIFFASSPSFDLSMSLTGRRMKEKLYTMEGNLMDFR